MDTQEDYCDILANAFDGVPFVGVRFRPSDEDLLNLYLFNKVHGTPYLEGVVFDFDLYGPTEPWQIWASFRGQDDDEDLYFFTRLTRPTTKTGALSAHASRKVGLAGGTWSGEGAPTPVFSSQNEKQVIGSYKRLRYENRKSPEHHGEWIMHEFSLEESRLPPNGINNDYVLCRIRKNDRPKKKLEKKRSYSEMESGQRVMPRETINPYPLAEATVVPPNNTSEEPRMLEMITAEGTDDMTTNNVTMDEEWAGNVLDFSIVPYVPETMTTNDGATSSIPFVLKMTTNDRIDDVEWRKQYDFNNLPSLPEMTTNDCTSSIPLLPELTTNDRIDDEEWRNRYDFNNMPSLPETNDGTSSSSPFVPEMTGNDRIDDEEWRNRYDFNNMLYEPEMTTNEGTSSMPYVPEMTTNDRTVDEEWRNFIMDLDNLPCVSEMTTNEVTSSMPHIPEITTNNRTDDGEWRNPLDFNTMRVLHT